MNEKDFKTKFSSRGTIKKKCYECQKEFNVKWHGRMSFYFADVCDICPECYQKLGKTTKQKGSINAK